MESFPLHVALASAAAAGLMLPHVTSFVVSPHTTGPLSPPPPIAPHPSRMTLRLARPDAAVPGTPLAASWPSTSVPSPRQISFQKRGALQQCCPEASARGLSNFALQMSTAPVEVVGAGGDSGGSGGGSGGSSGDSRGADGGVMTAALTDDFNVKTDLLNQVDLASSSKKRTEVNELMLKLEPMNPTEAPARSAVVNGVWEFLYTGGVSPGTLAVQVLSRVAKTLSAVVDLKGITLTIKRDQPRVEAAVKASVLGTQVQVKVRTRLEQRTDMRLQEVYEEAEVAGVNIPIPARIQPRRTLFITYLDDDIMIARDDTGAPDLLIRKQKDFRFNDGTPSTSEDDTSPGSG